MKKIKIAIAKAYNGVHKQFNQHLKELDYETSYFDIDEATWPTNVNQSKADFFLWQADDKREDYHLILDRVYFIEKYFKKSIWPDYNMYFSFNDKIKQKYIFDYLKIPIAPTFITYQKKQALNFINRSSYPFVLKNVYGACGKGVFKINNKKEAREVVEKIFSPLGFEGIFNYFYGQKFINHEGRDLRIVTVGNKIASAYWRISRDGNWKTNVSQGAEISFDNIPAKALEICLKISKQMSYHWMAYDCFVIKNKIYAGEFSPVFGVKGPRLQGVDIRKKQIEYLHQNFLQKIAKK